MHRSTLIMPGIGFVVIALSIAGGGAPIFPELVIASIPSVIFIVLAFVKSSFKSLPTLRLSFGSAIWAAAGGATHSPGTALLWGLGFGCIGWFIGSILALISELRDKINADQFEFSKHATDQSIRRNISVGEIREAFIAGEVIEDYPNDKYGPSCLVFGRTSMRRPLHVQCSYPSRPLVKIITLYEPDPIQWIDYRKRRQ